MEKINYKISTSPPPVYERAVKEFGVDFYGHPISTIFTYGDTIHVASGYLQKDVLAHELTHVEQQTTYPGGAAAWWERYFIDEDFRLQQEIEAYRRQYKFVIATNPNRSFRHEQALFYARCMKDMYSFEDMTVTDFYALIVNKR